MTALYDIRDSVPQGDARQYHQRSPLTLTSATMDEGWQTWTDHSALSIESSGEFQPLRVKAVIEREGTKRLRRSTSRSHPRALLSIDSELSKTYQGNPVGL